MAVAQLHRVPALVQAAVPALKAVTTWIEAAVSGVTPRHQRRLAPLHGGGALTRLASATAAAPARPHGPMPGNPDEAALLTCLASVHDAWRNRQARVIRDQVWRNALTGCEDMLVRLRRDQVERLLSRGYDRRFQTAVLVRYDMVQAKAAPAAVVFRHAA